MPEGDRKQLHQAKKEGLLNEALLVRPCINRDARMSQYGYMYFEAWCSYLVGRHHNGHAYNMNVCAVYILVTGVSERQSRPLAGSAIKNQVRQVLQVAQPARPAERGGLLLANQGLCNLLPADKACVKQANVRASQRKKGMEVALPHELGDLLLAIDTRLGTRLYPLLANACIYPREATLRSPAW